MAPRKKKEDTKPKTKVEKKAVEEVTNEVVTEMDVKEAEMWVKLNDAQLNEIEQATVRDNLKVVIDAFTSLSNTASEQSQKSAALVKMTELIGKLK